MDTIRRFNALGHRCVWSANGGYEVDGKRLREDDARALLTRLEWIAARNPVKLERPHVLREWSATVSKPNTPKCISEDDIAFAQRIVGNDRDKAIVLAMQFAAGKLKSVRKAFA